jgi:hypothetical protein
VAKLFERPPDEELASIRSFIETSDLEAVSDEVREIVERYLPDLTPKLPVKKAVPPRSRLNGRRALNTG